MHNVVPYLNLTLMLGWTAVGVYGVWHGAPLLRALLYVYYSTMDKVNNTTERLNHYMDKMEEVYARNSI